MKKLINAPENVVDEALAGMLAAHPGYIRVEEPNIVVRKDAPRAGKVGVISGGGSGHEPMHGGFVGMGMLDAACPGAVFTSPVPDQMLAATKAVDGGAGVLHIVKNYTGDIMNFEMAAEMARAEGHRGHGRRHRRRRRGEGQPVHGRPARRRRHRARGEDRRRGRRGGCRPRRPSRRSARRSRTTSARWAWRSRPAPCPRPASRPSRSRKTRWRSASASTASRAASRMKLATADEITEMLATPDPRRPAVRERATTSSRSSTAWAAPRWSSSTSSINKLAQMCAARGVNDHAQPGRQLHHLARDGRLLDHAAQARRRADQVLGCAGQHPRPPLGRLTGHPQPGAGSSTMSSASRISYDDVVAWIQLLAERLHDDEGVPDRARLRDRRCRPRHQHGSRLPGRHGQAADASRRVTSAPSSRASA